MAEGWETRRREARLGDVELAILEATSTGGRRIDVHQYFGRDTPYAEDLGRSARTFSVRAIVLGEDHDLAASRLRKLLERAGPHELTLPHLEPIAVAVTDFRISEPAGEARNHRVEFSAVEAGHPAIPNARPDTGGRVETFVGEALDALEGWFADAFEIGGQAQATIDAGVAVANEAAAAIRGALDELQAVTELADELDDVVRQVQTLEDTIAGTIVDAAVGVAQIRRTFESIAALPLAPLAVYRSLASVAEFGATLVDPGNQTVARRLQKENQDALVGVIRRLAAVERANVSRRIEFVSSTQAAEIRDELAAELAAAIEAASDANADDQVSRLRATRAAMIRDIDTRSARLPARVSLTLSNSEPVLALAQRLYGDAGRELEIVSRNRGVIRNPGRVDFGTVLEVLSE